MFPFVGFVILAYHAQAALSAPATYDQRQTGDLNVQLHVKDLKIVALVDSELLEDYTDYDYFYDYADFTIKPTGGKPTTASPTTAQTGSTLASNVSSAENSTELTATESTFPAAQNVSESIEAGNVAVPAVVEQNSNSTDVGVSSAEDTLTQSSTESTPAAEDASNATVKYRINDKAGNLFDAEDILLTSKDASSEAESTSADAKPVPGQHSRKRCRSGYAPDGKGRCRRLNRRRVSFVPIAMKLVPTSTANERSYMKVI